MSKGEVFLTPESREYYFDEGCFILEMLNTPSDPAVSIARARVEVGCTTRFHALNGVSERYVIQQGYGLVSLGNEQEKSVQVGSVVLIPPGVKQRISNTGTEPLVFLAICSPRFTAKCYQDLEG